MPEKKEALKEFDRKVLHILDDDSTLSFTGMARQLRSSPQVVEYRVKGLLERGIIKSFLTIIDYKKEGYTNYLVYFKFRGVLPKKEDEFVSFLKGLPLVNIILLCDGGWDMAVGVLARDPFELDDVLFRIHGEFGEYIDSQSINAHVGAEHYCRDYLLPGKEHQGYEPGVPVTGAKVPLVDLDDTDRKILYAVHEDARLPVTEIAERTGLSVDVVRYRLKILKERKVIVGSTFLPNYPKYEYLLYRVLLKLKHQPKARAMLFKYARDSPNIIRVINASGEYQGVIDIEIESPAAMRALLLDLRNQFKDVLVSYDSLYVHTCERFSYYKHGLDIGQPTPAQGRRR
jgi:Lrp/AsnC family leucine-responsive transcriptional regulator